MKIKVGNEIIKITSNKNNLFWKPIGMFSNVSEIKIDNQWYKCSINFIKKDSLNMIQISYPMLVDEKTSQIKIVHTSELYKELPVSELKLNLIKLLLNNHKMNYKIYKFKRIVFERLNTIVIFLLAMVLSAVFYYVNVYTNFNLINFVASNIWCQTIIMFLTISSFINIFFPFSIRRELKEKDITSISKETYKREKEEKEQNDRIERQSTF